MTFVKSTLPLLALSAFMALSFSACTTLENRRDLYSPAKAHGPYTRALREGTWQNGVQPLGQDLPPAPVAPAPHSS